MKDGRKLKKGLQKITVFLCALAMLSCSSTSVPVKVRPNAAITPSGSASTMNLGNTPFRSYDRPFLEKINARWNVLLTQTIRETEPEPGVVVVEFKLTYDGRVLDAKVTKNEPGDPFGGICRQAIVESAPFPPWLPDMRRMIGGNVREVTCTFQYR